MSDFEIRRFGAFELRYSTGELRKHGARLRLQEQPLRILEALLERPGELVGREHLKERLWPDEPAYRTDDNLNRAVKRLRETLGEDAVEPRFIETIRNRGYRFLAPFEAAPQPAPVGLDPRARSPFVGRRVEVGYFNELLERSFREGGGNVVFIGGEPGVGKTRLAEEVLLEAERSGARTSFGRCYETEGTPPFIAFSEAVERIARQTNRGALRELLGDRAPEVARIVPELSRMLTDLPGLPVLPPEMQRRNVFNGFLSFLKRLTEGRPLVLLLDDVHAADGSTLALLEHLAEHAATMPLSILSTFRDTEVDSHPRFAETLEEIIRKRLGERVSLQRFGIDEVREIVKLRSRERSSEEVVERLHRFTDGNAFYLEETLRDLGDAWNQTGWEIPANVRLVTGRRLERLNESCLRLLRSAAVIGRDFTVELLESVAKESIVDALEQAARAQLVRRGEDERYIFEHELIRQTLLSELSVPRRRRLHLEIASALERAVPGASAELTYHLRQAGNLVPPAKMFEALVLASENALEATAAEDALHHASDARELLASVEPSPPPSLLARLSEARGMALWALERWEEAMGCWSEALVLYESLDDVEAVSRVSRLTAMPLLWTGHFDAAAALMSRVEACIGTEPTEHRSLLLCTRAMSAWMGSAAEVSNALPAMNEAQTIARGLGSVELDGIARMYAGAFAMFRESHRLAKDLYTLSASLLRTTGPLYDLVYALTGLQAAHLSLGELAAVDAITPEAASLSDRIGHRGARLWVDRHRAFRNALSTGDLGPLRVHLVNRELGPALGDFARNWAYGKLGLVHFLTGDWAQAHEALGHGLSLEHDNITRGYAVATRFLLAAYRDEPEALALFRDHAFLLPRPDEVARSGQWEFVVRAVEGLAMLGERDAAAELYPAMDDLASRGAVTLLWGETLIQRIAGIAAAARENWNAAEQHFDAALRQAKSVPIRLEQPEVLRWHAWALRLRASEGDDERSRELLKEALELYEERAMPRHAELARAALS